MVKSMQDIISCTPVTPGLLRHSTYNMGPSLNHYCKSTNVTYWKLCLHHWPSHLHWEPQQVPLRCCHWSKHSQTFHFLFYSPWKFHLQYVVSSNTMTSKLVDKLTGSLGLCITGNLTNDFELLPLVPCLPPPAVFILLPYVLPSPLLEWPPSELSSENFLM